GTRTQCGRSVSGVGREIDGARLKGPELGGDDLVHGLGAATTARRGATGARHLVQGDGAVSDGAPDLAITGGAAVADDHGSTPGRDSADRRWDENENQCRLRRNPKKSSREAGSDLA